MPEGQENQPTLPEQVKESSKVPKYLYFFLFIAIVILIIVLLLVIFLPTEKPLQELTFEEQVRGCIEKTRPDEECNLIFIDPNIDKTCAKLEDLKDKCFYEIAIIKTRIDLCQDIQDENLKNKCEEEIILLPIHEGE